MTKFNLVFLFSIGSISLTISSNRILAQDNSIRKKLVGSWAYNGLEFPEEASKTDKKEAEKADQLNRGIIISISLDGKYRIFVERKQARDEVENGRIKLTQNERYFQVKSLEGYIAYLDSTYLKLFQPNRPIMVFRKL